MGGCGCYWCVGGEVCTVDAIKKLPFRIRTTTVNGCLRTVIQL